MNCGRLCSKKPTTPGFGWPSAARREKLVAYAVGDRSRPDVPAVVGGHSRGISAGALRNVFLGGLRGGDSLGTTLRFLAHPIFHLHRLRQLIDESHSIDAHRYYLSDQAHLYEIPLS